jgi:hypothetical protein
MKADSTAGEFAMSPSQPIRRSAARALCALLAFAMTFAPVTAAYGAATPLADIPIAAKVTAKPNIIYTLDDSGSMQYNYLPDWVVNAAANILLAAANPITRAGAVATATSSGASGFNNVAIGDWVNIIGAVQPEYNGFVQVTGKIGSNKIQYAVVGAPVSPATVAPGYGSIQVVTSASYCRSGNGTATCTQQPVAISALGTVFSATTITRPGPLATGGIQTATLTTSVANLANINVGDVIVVSNSNTTVTTPGSTSDPYYGVFTVTARPLPTTLQYQITAVAGVTPVSSGGNKWVISGTNSTNFAAPPLHASDFNRLAYNPAVTYTAPKKADGLPLTNTGTDANGNYAYNSVKWATPSVDRDPFSAYETLAAVTPMWPATTKDDLSVKVGVSLYCNTDWPLLVNDSNWPTGPNGASVRDVGDTNGQYQATTGSWCRINGTKYDLSVASGAPATAVAGVEMGYNYPWQSSSGAKGTAYFFTQANQANGKTLWCDKTSPYWPRNGVIIGCTMGGTPTCGGVACPTNQQKCNAPTAQCNPTPALRNYNPAACNSSALYCLPNVNGSDSTSPGTGTAPECIPCTCKSDYTPANGSCNLLGGACSPPPAYGVLRPTTDPQCPGVPATPNGCSAGVPIYSGPASSASCTSFLWDPVAGVYSNNPASSMFPGVTLLDDAGKPAAGAANTSGAPGSTCRHNNYTYAVGGAAGPFKYGVSPFTFPGEGAGTGKFDTAVVSSCPAIGTTVQIPRHYYVVDRVEFCDNRIVTPDAQWRGFGAGNCQLDNNDLQRFKEVRYGKFVRVDLFPTNALDFAGTTNFPYVAGQVYPGGRAWLAGAGADPSNSESINYANWYAYYSTRLNAAKSTSATAFSYLTPLAGEPVGYRVGFHNLGEEPTGFGGNGTPIIWLDVNDWDPTKVVAAGKTQLQLWYDKLFGISVNNFKTPTLDAMLRIGNLVEKGVGGSAGLPSSINPLPAAAADPFPINPATGNPVHCTNNYHILFTDGKTNQVTPVTTPGDQDQIVPSR